MKDEWTKMDEELEHACEWIWDLSDDRAHIPESKLESKSWS